MNPDYIESLSMLRRAFGPASETPILTEIIRQQLAGHSQMTMLDIGIGDGSSARKIMSSLSRHGIQVHLTGVDPYIPAVASLLKWPRIPRLIVSSLEDFHAEPSYDVVNATQSLYYLGDQSRALAKLTSLLLPDGMLTITIWDEGCTLKKIHDDYLAPERRSPSPKHIERWLTRTLPQTYKVFIHHFEGIISLDVSPYRDRVAAAILDIAGRGAMASASARARALRYLNSLGAVATRRNAIIVALPSVGPSA